MRGIFNKKNGKITQSNQINDVNSEHLSDSSSYFVDNEKLTIDTQLGNNLDPSKSTHSNEANQESIDLQTYKKFISFLKFKEMMDKYNT